MSACEPRRLMAALVVNGTDLDDTISVSVTAGVINVVVNGTSQSHPDTYDGIVVNPGNNSFFGFDEIRIESTGDNPVTVNMGGGGNDRLLLAPTSRNLDAIGSRVTVPAGPLIDISSDQITLYDDNTAFGDEYVFNGNNVDRADFGGLTNASTTARVALSSGAGGDTFTVNSLTYPLTLDGQSGMDVLNQAGGTVGFENTQDFLSVNVALNAHLYLSGDANQGLLLGGNASSIEGDLYMGKGWLIERNSRTADGFGYWRYRLLTGKSGSQPGLRIYDDTQFGGGYSYGSDLAFNSLNGFAIGANDLLIRYTRKGDTDLDRDVDFDDLLALSQNYGILSNRDWRQGDFDLSRGVTFDDLLPLSQNFGLAFLSLLGVGTIANADHTSRGKSYARSEARITPDILA